jgi:transcriptional regulator with XRE-family HTH domain/energy-coupling factor transporter ATP-binding protein EcfA2
MVIATKKRKPRGVPVHERGITLIETMRIEKGWDREELAGKAGFKDKKTIDRALQGIPIDENSIEKIARALGIDFNDLIDLPPKKVSTHSQSSLDNNLIGWQKICGEMLRKQKEARQLRKEATSIGAEVNVYVPLDLLEHKEQTRSKQDKADSDQRNQYQELKVVKTYEHNDFLRSLTDRQSKNKHIAIVGEAGAGKTTLLARIADELDKNQKLQIFVSLADLQGRSIDDYIYRNWLPDALGVHKDSINAEQTNDLFQQFQSGEIWLLLDGLDEMRAKSSADALEKINREIREVIGQSRVVLTSRLNVWDAYLNRMSGFDTFRMGDFSPEQVDKFIGDWFVEAGKPESAPILQAKLKEPNRDRIRDMVRNPLRLALLCQAFYRDLNTELPETKAGLYELFVRYFYEWKPNIVDEDLTQDTLREELHLALGKLAIAGIDSDAGFRLSRSLAVKEMGDRLFKLASDVGWLTLIERDEQDQEVYAFYHASFQEYFAALAITNWKFFINRNSSLLEPESYRIFEKKWEEVVVFWIGKREVNKNKQDFIDMIVNNFQPLMEVNLFEIIYKIKAYFIAAKCIIEFKDYYQCRCLLERIINVFIGHLDLEDKDWITFDFIRSLSSEARETFRNIANRLNQEANEILLERLSQPCFFLATNIAEGNSSIYSEFRVDTMKRLELTEEIVYLNKDNFKISIIDKLKTLLKNRSEEQIRLSCAYALLELDTNTSIGQDELIRLKDNTVNEIIRKQALEILCTKNCAYSDFLDEEYNLDSAIESLKSLKNTNKDINNISTEIYDQSWYKIIVDQFLMSGHALINGYPIDPSLYIVFEDSELKEFLIDIMLNGLKNNSIDWINTRQGLETMQGLEINAVGSEKAIKTLEDIIIKTNSSTLQEHAAYTLRRIDTSNQKAISVILELIKNNLKHLKLSSSVNDITDNNFKTSMEEDFRSQCKKNISENLYYLGYVETKDDDLVIKLFDFLEETTDLTVQLSIARCILSFDSSNSIAISFLINLLNNRETTDPEMRLSIVDCILSFDSSNLIAISFLIDLLNNSEDNTIANNVLITLLEYLGWKECLKYMINSFSSSKYNSMSFYGICGELKEKISVEEIPSFISFIKSYPQIYWGNNFVDLLWYFSHKIRYQEFYYAWEHEISDVDNCYLESQFLIETIQKELDCTAEHPEIRCLVVDIRQLEQESDPNVIAKKLTNKIFNSIHCRIPVVQDVSCLERELLNLKLEPEFEKLAIALYGKNANEAIHQLCQNLTESIHICPFTGEKSTQELTNDIKAWLRRINLEYN